MSDTQKRTIKVTDVTNLVSASTTTTVGITGAGMVAKFYALDKSKIITLLLDIQPKMNLRSLSGRLDENGKVMQNPFFARDAAGDLVKNDKKQNVSYVRQVTKQNGFIGVNYENCVNNVMEKETGERGFIADPPVWGEAVNESKGLHCHVVEGQYDVYVPFNLRNHIGDSYYYDVRTGEVIDDAETLDLIRDFIPSKTTESKKQLEHGIQEENIVMWRKPKVESVIAICGIATKGVVFKRSDYEPTCRLGV